MELGDEEFGLETVNNKGLLPCCCGKATRGFTVFGRIDLILVGVGIDIGLVMIVVTEWSSIRFFLPRNSKRRYSSHDNSISKSSSHLILI